MLIYAALYNQLSLDGQRKDQRQAIKLCFTSSFKVGDPAFLRRPRGPDVLTGCRSNNTLTPIKRRRCVWGIKWGKKKEKKKLEKIQVDIIIYDPRELPPIEEVSVKEILGILQST